MRQSLSNRITVEASPRGIFLIDDETGAAIGFSIEKAENIGRAVLELTQKVLEDCKGSTAQRATQADIDRMHREIARRKRDKILGLGETREAKPPAIDGGYLCSRVKGAGYEK